MTDDHLHIAMPFVVLLAFILFIALRSLG